MTLDDLMLINSSLQNTLEPDNKQAHSASTRRLVRKRSTCRRIEEEARWSSIHGRLRFPNASRSSSEFLAASSGRSQRQLKVNHEPIATKQLLGLGLGACPASGLLLINLFWTLSAGLAIVIMGVSGCGKSTVAALLAEALGCTFIEADDYHSQANKAKMGKGIPLSDADRKPWLESLQVAIREHLDRGEDVVASCSALQLKYREILRAADGTYKPGTGSYATCRVKFVCLKASAAVISERMKRRSREGKHFMPASLLQSQLDLLQIEADEGITEVDATARPDDVVRDTIAQFKEELASTVAIL